jgi:hypothetical protein
MEISFRKIFQENSKNRLGVWSTGLGASPFVKSLPFMKDKAGRLLVDNYFHVMENSQENSGEKKFLNNVFAVKIFFFFFISKKKKISWEIVQV